MKLGELLQTAIQSQAYRSIETKQALDFASPYPQLPKMM
jgi:hypothetical protein